MQQIRGITLAQDEVVIREYEASNLETMNAKGYIIATNLRLIFTGSVQTALGNSLIVRDTKIDNVSGIVGGLSRKKSLVTLIIGILILLVGLFTFLSEPSIIAFIILVLGGFVTYLGTKQSGERMYMMVMGGQTSPSINVSVEAATGFFSRIQSNDAFLTVAASGPGANTEQLIRELGALVQDIQTMGNLAIDKWKNTSATTQNYTALTPQFTKPTQPPVSNNAGKTCACGTVAEVDAAFCPECGSRFEANLFG